MNIQSLRSFPWGWRLSWPTAFCNCGCLADDSTLTKVGDKSPFLPFRTIDGKEVKLEGQVVVLNFFATWCGPCMSEMPHLQKKLWEPLEKKGLVLIAVGREHSEAEVKAFKDKKGFTFAFAADPSARSSVNSRRNPFRGVWSWERTAASNTSPLGLKRRNSRNWWQPSRKSWITRELSAEKRPVAQGADRPGNSLWLPGVPSCQTDGLA